MKKRLTKKDIAVLDNLDRLLAGEPLKKPYSFLEEKLLQVLQSITYSREKQQDQLDNISRLISDISHQIKTPLSALSLHLELASDPEIPPEEKAESIIQCMEQAEKIRFLSEAILKVARLESGLIAVKRVPEDVVRTLKEAAAAVRRTAEEKGLRFQVKAPDSLILAHDPLWTKEAILNLLDNAIKYTEKGGISLSLAQGPVYTRIDVADTDTPLEPSEYAKVFGRFYRVRRTGHSDVGGTGLGLPIAREIMRQQNGNITVSSVEKGNTFSLFLQNC